MSATQIKDGRAGVAQLHAPLPMDRFLAALSNELPAALGGTKSVQRAASYFGRFAEQIAPPPAATSVGRVRRLLLLLRRPFTLLPPRP